MSNPLALPEDLALRIAVHLQQHGYPEAGALKLSQTQSLIEVSPDRLVVIEGEDEADAREIVAAIMKRAKGGDLDAAEWLDARGVVTLPPKKDGAPK